MQISQWSLCLMTGLRLLIMEGKPAACLGGFGCQANVVGDKGHQLAVWPLNTRRECLLLGLAWHNTVVEDRQVVIKTAVIPTMNSSWAGTQRGKSKGWTGREGQKKERQRRAAGVKRGEDGDHYARTMGLFSTVCRPRFRADVLTVSGSMEREIPTKGGVQILWEIRPLFNISWRPTIYSWDSIPLEGPTFRLTPRAQWAALNWVPAHSSSPWQIVHHESPCLFILLFFSLRVVIEKGACLAGGACGRVNT